MVFKSDRQRKGFFGSLGSTRSSTRPRMTTKTITRLPKNVRDFISKEISRQRKEGKPQAQSIAIAFSKARKKFPSQKKKLSLMNSPRMSQKRIRNLIFLLFGTALALQILRQVRK